MDEVMTPVAPSTLSQDNTRLGKTRERLPVGAVAAGARSDCRWCGIRRAELGSSYQLFWCGNFLERIGTYGITCRGCAPMQ